MSTVNSVYSGPTIVYPHDVLTVVTDPVAVTAIDGEEFTMTAAFSGGTAPIAYQWQELLAGGSWANISGQTTITLTHTATLARDQAQYRCKAEGQQSQPVWTLTAILTATLPAAPTITIAPLAPSVTEGDVIAFVATAAGAGTLTYQWKVNGAEVGGATAATYNRTTVLADDGLGVECVVTDGHGQASVSAPAIMTVAALIPEVGLSWPMPMVASQWVATGSCELSVDPTLGALNIRLGPGGGNSNLAVPVTPGVQYMWRVNRMTGSHSQVSNTFKVGSAIGGSDQLNFVEPIPKGGLIEHLFTPTVSPVYASIDSHRSDGAYGNMFMGDMSIIKVGAEPGAARPVPEVLAEWNEVNTTQFNLSGNGVQFNGAPGTTDWWISCNVGIPITNGARYRLTYNRIAPSDSGKSWRFQIGSAVGLDDVHTEAFPPAGGVVSFDFIAGASGDIAYITVKPEDAGFGTTMIIGEISLIRV